MAEASEKNGYDAWLAANQQALSAALDVTREHLRIHAARVSDEQSAVKSEATRLALLEEKHSNAIKSAVALPAFEALSALFDLSGFERNVLLMCAGMELQASFANVCAEAQGNAQTPYPTFGLALAAFPEAHWSALAPNAPLRYWRLIEFASSAGLASAPLTTRPLRIDERILHCLCGISHLDERLSNSFKPISFAETLTESLAKADKEIALRAALVWSQSQRHSLPAIVFCGTATRSARDVALYASEKLELKLYELSPHRLPSNREELEIYIRLCERESALSRIALLVETETESDESRVSSSLKEFMEQTRCPIFVVSREQRRFGLRHSVCFELHAPPVQQQRELWQIVLAGQPALQERQLDALTSQFNLAPSEIISIAGETTLQTEKTDLFAKLWEACRLHSRARLETLAQRIEPVASWDDLILPAAQKETLRAIVTHVRQRAKVYDQWGFAGKGSRGLGISALFAGASGTGKTMAAEVLAQELQLDLYRIDLSAVVSKYIGETEKNLRQLFDAAELGGAILLFDEADALFGKRSEVKDSHDRYANIEVSYLLQRMESYRGLAILTTNLKSALDAAFLRRIRFVVQFPFPDAADREAIWRGIFPKEAPLNGVDFSKLAQLNIAGGNIRNIAMSAAFLAADVDEKIEMSQLLQAAQGEYAKMEKVVAEAETVGWK